jgi:hypothetical protein
VRERTKEREGAKRETKRERERERERKREREREGERERERERKRERQREIIWVARLRKKKNRRERQGQSGTGNAAELSGLRGSSLPAATYHAFVARSLRVCHTFAARKIYHPTLLGSCSLAASV